jgi:hypothetical protein
MANLNGLQRRQAVEVLFLAGSVCLSGALFVWVFNYLPIENTSLGLDWRIIWNGLHRGQVVFGGTDGYVGGLFTPPWGILFLLPLGFLSFRNSWGVISFVSIIILALCVPRTDKKKQNVLAIILLLVSFPALRNLADGNLEALVIGGIVLLIFGYNHSSPAAFSLGLLLATIKFQETWLLCLFMLYLVYKNWRIAQQLQMLVLTGAVLAFSLLIWGDAWFSAVLIDKANQVGKGSLIDISISAALGRLGVSSGFIVFARVVILGFTLLLLWRRRIRRMSWLYATFLVSASLLLAPYASGNSFLTVVAIGIISLFQQRRRLGITLLILTSVPFLASREVLYCCQAYYWTFLLFVVWGTVGYLILTHEADRVSAGAFTAVQDD